MITFHYYDLALAEASQNERFWQDPEQFEDYDYVPTDISDEEFDKLIDEFFEFIND